MFSVEYPLWRASFRPRHEGEPRWRAEVTPTIRALRACKERVPRIREAKGAEAWDRTVARLSAPLPMEAPPERASRAYFKLREILSSCAIPPSKASAHLCEAPGGFVQAVQKTAEDEWRWVALTLDGKIVPRYDVLPMERGKFVLGDVFEFERVAPLFERGAFDLVTADGAFELNHDSLEDDHFGLLVAQTRLAMHALQAGGTFVIKFFEGTCAGTVLWLAWLTSLFSSVSVIKPTASRATNSERYAVACGYCATEAPLGPEELCDLIVSREWLHQIRTVLDRLNQRQIEALEKVCDQFEPRRRQ